MDNNDTLKTHGEEPHYDENMGTPASPSSEEVKPPFENAANAPELDYPQPFLARTIATGDKMFLILDNKRHWIMSPEVLHGLGFEFGDEKEIKYTQLTKFEEGEAVNLTEMEKFKGKLGISKTTSVEDKPVEPVEQETHPEILESVMGYEKKDESTGEVTGKIEVDSSENYHYEVVGAKPTAVFIIPLIRSDYITKYLDSLYKYTDIDFKVIVIDQTLDKTAYEKNKDRVHLWINAYRNLGFSKAHNTGAILAMREDPDYIVFSNDDIEFMNKRWWQGIMDTFAQDKQIIGVNPNSPRIAMWGYGVDEGYLDLVDYKDEFTDQDYDFLLAGDFASVKANKKVKKNDGTEVNVPESFPAKQSGVIDAVATWCTVFRTDKLKEVGLWDERFFPGSGEDYDMMARAYSRAYPDSNKVGEAQHYRVVGTTKSWAWHHWTRSKDYFNENPEAREKLMKVRDNFSDAGEPWREGSEGNFDVWGNYDKNGVKTPLVRQKKIIVSSL